MRFWNPIRDPDRPQSRQRTVIRGVPPSTNFGVRPMFSRADEENEPSTSEMAAEARLDDIVPADNGPGSEARAELVRPDSLIPTFLTYALDDVSSPPSEAEIQAAFGPRSAGFIGFIVDAGGAGKVWLCVKFRSYWHYVGMTRAT